MGVNDVVTIISTVGFPIAACVALFWQIDEMRQSHKEEMDGVKEALNNNTLVVQKLVDKLSDIVGKEEQKDENIPARNQLNKAV